MKHLIFLLFLGLLSLPLSAQDLIVTQEGDSLNCQIVKVKKDYLYFLFSQDGEVRSTLLPRNEVKLYRRDFFAEPEISGLHTPSNPKYPVFRLSVQGGWSQRLAQIPDGTSSEMTTYIKELKRGLNLGVDAAWYGTESFGFGLKYSRFHSKNSRDGAFSDNVGIHFFGPALASRLISRNRKGALIYNLAFGLMNLRNKAISGNNEITIQGSTAGLACDLGYDFGINNQMSFGLQASFFTGSLGSLKIQEGQSTRKIQLDPEERESLTHLNLSAGFRIWL